jgi:hypothetical protein
MTPLHWAIDRGFDSIAEILLDHGADPHICSKFMKTPYSLAKEKKNDFIVRLIEQLPNSDNKSTEQLNASCSSKTDDSESSQRDRNCLYHPLDTKSSLNDTNNVTLQLLKEQMNMMSANNEESLIESAIQSGRRIMLSEAGKRLLNDSSLNKFLKIPLNTTISPASTSAQKRSSVSPRSATITSPRISENSDVLEVYRDNNSSACGSVSKKTKPDILNIIHSDEVTITHRLKTSPAPSPTQMSSVSLSAINVPKHKSQKLQGVHKNILSSATDVKKASNTMLLDKDYTQMKITECQFSELSNNYIQMKKLFEKEQLKTAALSRQLKQLEKNFEMFKHQQNEKFESILTLLMKHNQEKNVEDKDNFLDNEEIL